MAVAAPAFCRRESPSGLYVLCGWEMEKLMMLLAEDAPEVLFFSTETDGGRDFTPWKAEPLAREPFRAEGKTTSKFDRHGAAVFRGAFRRADGTRKLCAAGVLARRIICALGADENGKIRCRCKPFRLFVVPAVLKYLENCPLKKDTAIYLSLGDREPLGGPPVMRTVGDCTEKAREILSNHGCKVFFEWNQGGHGKGVTKRWQRAVRRLLTMMAKTVEK